MSQNYNVNVGIGPLTGLSPTAKFRILTRLSSGTTAHFLGKPRPREEVLQQWWESPSGSGRWWDVDRAESEDVAEDNARVAKQVHGLDQLNADGAPQPEKRSLVKKLLGMS